MGRKIGIFGGSFNPIHYGHLRGAESALDELCLDMVLFVPSYISPHKPDAKMIPAKHRVKMVQMSIKDNPSFKLSTFEVKKRSICYTIDTVRHFIETLPSQEIFLIIGSDSLNEIHTWKDWRELLNMCHLAVIKRPGSPPRTPEGFVRKGRVIYSRKGDRIIYILNNPMVSISSTQIRNLWLKGRSVRYLLPEEVREYVENKKLWRYWK